MANESPNEKSLRTASFVVHATRGVIRDHNTRRKTMFILLIIALALLFCGSTFLQTPLNHHEHPIWFLLFWLTCGWLTLTAMLLFFRPIRDSQSGMWVFRRAILDRLRVTSDGMPFSQEIKLEAILRGFRFGESHIAYGARIGEVKLQKWRDGWLNLSFLFRKRLGLL